MSAYSFKKNLRKLFRTPADVAATPTTDRLIADEAAGTSRREGLLADAAETRKLNQVRFDRTMGVHRVSAERANNLRRGYLDLDKARLDDARKQNRIATGISLGNIAITGASGRANMKRQDKNDQLMQQYTVMQQEMLELTRKFTDKYLSTRRAQP